MHRNTMRTRALFLSSCFLLPLLLLVSLPFSSGQLAFVSSDSCPSTSRYDSTSLDCKQCGVSSSSALADPAQSVDPSNRERCVCNAGYQNVVAANNVDEYSFTCNSCFSQGLAALKDGSKCVPCASGGNATLSSVTRDCVCPAGQIIAEYDAGGTLFPDGKHCIPCSNSTQVFQSPTSALFDPYTCRTCPDSNMIMDAQGICSCVSPYSKAPYGQSEVCLLSSLYNAAISTYAPNNAAVMQYNDVRSSDSNNAYSIRSPFISSIVVYNYFGVAMTNCVYQKDRQGCQMLANLCVLQKYHQGSSACLAFSAASTPVTTYEHGFTASSTGSSINGWKSTLPYLYQPQIILRSNAQLILQDVTLTDTTTSDNSRTGTLHFRLYKYSINGTYLGWELLTSQLQLCSGDPKIMNNYLRFGTNYANSCQLDLTPYLTLNETIFYDMYLVDANNAIYPVPIKVMNMRQGDGDTPNRDSNGNELISDDNLLSRRFYLVDATSGKTEWGATTRVLSYLAGAILRVEIQGSSNSVIRPPLLVLSYAERETQDILDGNGKQYSGVSFSVEYLKDNSGLWQAAYGLFGTALILSLFLTVRRIWNWQRKNGNEVLEINVALFLRFVVYTFSAMGDLFFIMLCCLTFYAWLFYKGQKTVHFLLPGLDSSEVHMMNNFIIICFVAKLMEVLFKLYQQIRIETFFIDWEKPRGSLDLPSEEGGAPADSGPNATSVSAWRKLMAANKWNDLQTTRLVNVPFTLFLMIFLMEPSGIGLKYLATAQPSPSNLDSSAAPLHPMLNFAVTTFFLLIICYLQLLFHRQITHRYYKDEIAQFVDLLCTSNISALMLDEKQHGYYIHGKTVHPHADVSLEEMNAAILSEEKTLTRERGLIPGKDTFEIFVTHSWRSNYDELYTRLFTKQAIHQARAARSAARGNMDMTAEIELGRPVSNTRGRHVEFEGQGNPGGTTDSLISSALLRANASLNLWLTAFINREPQFPYPYDFGEFDSTRKLLGLPVDLPPNAPCTLYDDADFKFTSTLMCGIEGDLSLFLVLLYAFMNMLFNSILVATLVCFIVDRLLVGFRSHWGTTNLARSTLVSSKFLI